MARVDEAWSGNYAKSPIGAMGPYGYMRGAKKKLIPLSVFFLQMTGDDGGEAEAEEEPEMLGLVREPSKKKERNPLPKAKGHEKDAKSTAESTMAANVATTPVPIGAPLRRAPGSVQDRKRWMGRLKKMMR